MTNPEDQLPSTLTFSFADPPYETRLRDLFAASALEALIDLDEPFKHVQSNQEQNKLLALISKKSYAYADAMMEARQL